MNQLDNNVPPSSFLTQNDDIPVFLQGVWGRHFPDIRSEYVHPISGEGPLWLCHVCSHPAGLSGGKNNMFEVKQLKQWLVHFKHLGKYVYILYEKIDGTFTFVC